MLCLAGIENWVLAGESVKGNNFDQDGYISKCALKLSTCTGPRALL